MLPYFRVGPFLVQLTGLALLLGVWVGSWLAEKQAVKVEIKPDLIYTLIFVGLISGLVGARLVYAARYLNAYLANPLSVFALSANTLSPSEGALIGLVVAFTYGQRKGLRLRPVLDALAPGLAAFLIFLGAAHLLSGDAFGAPSRVPWAIFLWGEYRQPTQIYEILLSITILLVTLNHSLREPGQGINFWRMIALSATARIFLEAFRGDSLIWPGGFRAAQVVSLLVLAFSLWMMWVWRKNPTDEEQEKQMKTFSE